MGKYKYRVNGGEWEEIQVPTATEQKPRDPENSFEHIAYWGLIGCIFGVPGGALSYFAAEAWGGLVVGIIGGALASSLDDADEDTRDALLMICGSVALVSFGRLVPLAFGSLS